MRLFGSILESNHKQINVSCALASYRNAHPAAGVQCMTHRDDGTPSALKSVYFFPEAP